MFYRMSVWLNPCGPFGCTKLEDTRSPAGMLNVFEKEQIDGKLFAFVHEVKLRVSRVCSCNILSISNKRFAFVLPFRLYDLVVFCDFLHIGLQSHIFIMRPLSTTCWFGGTDCFLMTVEKVTYIFSCRLTLISKGRKVMVYVCKITLL